MPTDARFYAQPFPVYQPAMRCILSISQSYPVIITTTYDGVNPGAHQYLTGLIVRLNIPQGWGMSTLNRYESKIIVLNSTQFTMPIDTTNLDAYVIPELNPGHFATPPTVTPVGEVSMFLNQSTENVLPYT
jgi:hypothetical protein